jgi:hypothetical protein
MSLLPLKTIGQDSISGIEVGFTLGFLTWNKFYDSDVSFSSRFSNSINIDIVSDLIIKFPVEKRSAITLNLSNMQKANKTETGILYKLDYVTFSPLYGREFYWIDSDFFVGIGPYFGYLYNAKKGDESIDNLKSWDYGLEFLMNYGDRRNKKSFDFMNFNSLKFQLGLRDVLYFKTMSFSISTIGTIF